MEKQALLRKIGFQAAIVAIFIALSYIYFFPLLDGKELATHDIQMHIGMSKEIADFNAVNGKNPGWTNAAFGGMPGYMILADFSSNLLTYLQNGFRKLFHPAAMLILYLLGFYILLSSLKVDRFLRVAGAIAYGFSSYLLIIIAAGHNTKAYALGYLVIAVAGALMAYRHDRVRGALLFTTGMALEINAGHPQMTYYGMLALAVFGITELVYSIREKRIIPFLKTTGLITAGTILALIINFSYLYTNLEYSKETIRGKSELTHNTHIQTSGLDKDYVVQWSQGIGETLTLLIPNFKGGSHATNPGIRSESYKALEANRIQNPREVIRQIIMYHGDKPFTSGPYYAGAIVVFLFVLGLFVVKGADKYWLLAATIMSVVLSWGKYVMPLTSFLLEYLPLYNKFRAPEMTLIIAGFTMPLLGFLGLQRIISGQVPKPELMNALKMALGITGGLTLLFVLLPGLAGDFSAPFDSTFPDWLLEAVHNDRQSLLRADAFRSLIFILLAASALWLWIKKKISLKLFAGALALLILVDLWAVDKRYLNNDNFSTPREARNTFAPTAADSFILKDTTLSYRVLTLQNPWAESRTSYFHKSLGGYHAAKLRRYQEMIEFHFTPEMQQMIEGLRADKPESEIFNSLNAINMMNTKYIIYDLNSTPLINHSALGNAWFANQYEIVADADDEIDKLKEVNPATTAVIDQRFAYLVEGKSFATDSAATIQLIEYQPNQLKYQYQANSPQLAVFSEVYYDKGWKAYIGGQEHPHFRVNYILRAMALPAGDHTVEFRFEPRSYNIGNKVSLAGSVLLLLLLAGALGYGLIVTPKAGRAE